MMRIVCLGDSNTYGYDPRGFWGGRYDPQARWPDLLAAQTGWEVINEGSNGRCIPKTPSADIPAGDCIAVMLGTNDLLQGASPEEAAGKMKTFLKQLLPVCDQLLLIAPPPMTLGEWVPSREWIHRSNRLADEYRRISRELAIPFVDTRDWKIQMCYDGVHFTEAGHRAFARALAQILVPLLQE